MYPIVSIMSLFLSWLSISILNAARFIFTSRKKKSSDVLKQSILPINTADNTIGRSIFTRALRNSMIMSIEAPKHVIQASRIATRIYRALFQRIATSLFMRRTYDSEFDSRSSDFGSHRWYRSWGLQGSLGRSCF